MDGISRSHVIYSGVPTTRSESTVKAISVIVDPGEIAGLRAKLAETKPLLSPSGVAQMFLLFNVCIFEVIGLLLTFFSGLKWSDPALWLMAAVQLVLAGVMVLPFLLLFWQYRGRPVFYLRAFRTDRHGGKLRSTLAAILGPGHRLTGIRPPAKRGPLFLRSVFTLGAGFRTLGSPSFELEAHNDNWMARLLASYHQGRFLFIDVRDVTTHVLDEIVLSYTAFGSERCVFITDATRTDEGWRRWVRETVGDARLEESRLMLLPCADDADISLGALAPPLQEFLRRIPTGPADVAPEAIAFVLEKTAATAWRPRPVDTDVGRIVMAYLGMIVINLFLTWLITGWKGMPVQYASKVVAAFISTATMMMFFLAWGRAWWQAGFEKRHAAVLGRKTSRRRLGVALLLGVGLCAFIWLRLLLALISPAAMR